jgi:hypothetical protein
MSERFDDMSKAMAGAHSRRSVLKILGGAAGAAVAATVLKPFRGDAIPVTCTGPTNVGPSPCAAGKTPCGPCCCKAGIACVDASRGVCGCPSGTTPCGSACCQKGTACANPSTSTCAVAAVSCTEGQTACDKTCCATGQSCVGGTCSTCASSVCAGKGNSCNSLTGILCPNNADCACVTTTEGCQACVNLVILCSGIACTSSSTCAAGSVCVANPGGASSAGCCDTANNFCTPLCSTGQ